MEDNSNQETIGEVTTTSSEAAVETASTNNIAASVPQPHPEFNNQIEPDSLMMTSSELDKALWDKEDEIVQAFENEENDVEVIDRATSVDMSASRASVDSQRSVSFFC